MAISDVEVFGGGIFGLSIAYSLARSGTKVRVIERKSVGSGSSGGCVGALAPHAPENWNSIKQFQLEALVAAEEWWTEVGECSGVDPHYSRCGRLVALPDDNALELAKRRSEGALRHWQHRGSYSIEEASGKWLPVSKSGHVVRDTLSARINPVRALECLVKAVRSLGGIVDEGTAEPRRAPVAVLATGHRGLEDLSRQLGYHVGGGQKGQAALVRHDAGGEPQIFADGLYIVPHEDGTTAIGSTSERDFDKPNETDMELDRLVERARRIVPALDDAPVVRRWAGVRPRATTRKPILGFHPLDRTCIVANGGFKIGIGIAPRVGECISELILSGTRTFPEEFLPGFE